MQIARIRPATLADAEAIAGVHVASWRSAYQDILPTEFLAGLSVERRATFWARQLADPASPDVTLVAEHPSAGIIGFANAGAAQELFPGYDAELRAIYLLHTYQRAGVGRVLMARVAADLLARGHAALFLWVFAENASRHFYT
ncbi:MAG: GNAT family N-acetyltransferase [Chloroflexi bacterium OHK40]